MATKYIFGCDIGTTSTKAVILNQKGEVCASSKESYGMRFPRSGWAEQDANEYWLAFCRCTHTVLEQSKFAATDIEVIGLSGMAPNCILVDKNLDPLKPGLVWMDTRAIEECNWLKQHLGEEKAWQISANAIHPYYGIPKLMWEHKHNETIYNQSFKVLSAKEFVIAHLTRQVSIDYSTAALFSPGFDIRSKDWDLETLENAGIDADKMPSAFPCDHIVGKVTEEASKQCGLSAGIPVMAGTVDTGADAAACGIIEPGSSFLTMGTAICLGIVLDGPQFVRGLMAFPHAINSTNRYITTGAITSGGALMNWYKDILSWHTGQSINSQELFAQLDKEATQIPAGSDGLIVLPYFMGERAPIWDPFARGVFFGLSLKHSRGHIARALMESVGYGLKTIIELGRQSGNNYADRIYLIGGGAQSHIWNQIIASITGLKTVEVKNPLGSAVGAAMVAGLGTGIYSDYRDVTQHLHFGSTIMPVLNDYGIYEKSFSLFKELYRDLKPRFIEIPQNEITPTDGSRI